MLAPEESHHRSFMFLCLNFLVARSGALFSNCDPCSSNINADSSFASSLAAASPLELWVDVGCGISNRKIVCFFGMARTVDFISTKKILAGLLNLTLELILLRNNLKREFCIPDHNPSQTHHAHTSTPHNRNLCSMVIRTREHTAGAFPSHKSLLIRLQTQYLPYISHPHPMQRHIYLIPLRTVRNLVDAGISFFFCG